MNTKIMKKVVFIEIISVVVVVVVVVTTTTTTKTTSFIPSGVNFIICLGRSYMTGSIIFTKSKYCRDDIPWQYG
jgi:hypothetical protein